MTKARIGCLVAGVALFGIGAWGVYSAAKGLIVGEGSDVNEAIADARKVGLPLTQEELVSTLKIREADNAVPLFRSAAVALEKVTPPMTSTDFRKNTRGNAQEKAAAKAYIKRAASALDLLRKASERTGLDWGRDWDQGVMLEFPEYRSIKDLLWMLSVSAQYSAEQGDFGKAVDDLVACRKVSMLLASDHTMIGVLVGIALDAITLSGVNKVINLSARNPAILSRIEKEVLGKKLAFQFEEVFRNECYMTVAIVRNLDLYGGFKALTDTEKNPGNNWRSPQVPVDKLRRDGLPPGLIDRVHLSRVLEYWAKAMAILRANPDDLVKVFKDIDALTKKFEAEKSTSAKVAMFLIPDTSRFGFATTRAEANRLSHLGLCKVVAYKAAHGRFPQTLKEAGVTFKDPFGGGEMRYKVRGAEVLVYSVGEDLADDNGAPDSGAEDGTGMRKGDVAAFYPPRPPKQ
ncbi:MAG: hypothetical protein KF784_03090 [Fimbriimonadaceae bacterium]|nr:hypothetical protein [Fimbriimonadaceae bacterium]